MEALLFVLAAVADAVSLGLHEGKDVLEAIERVFNMFQRLPSHLAVVVSALNCVGTIRELVVRTCVDSRACIQRNTRPCTPSTSR